MQRDGRRLLLVDQLRGQNTRRLVTVAYGAVSYVDLLVRVEECPDLRRSVCQGMSENE
jgi:hypothetical protein